MQLAPGDIETESLAFADFKDVPVLFFSLPLSLRLPLCLPLLLVFSLFLENRSAATNLRRALELAIHCRSSTLS